MNNNKAQEVLDTLGMITVMLISCGAFTGVVGAVTYATDSLTAPQVCGLIASSEFIVAAFLRWRTIQIFNISSEDGIK